MESSPPEPYRGGPVGGRENFPRARGCVPSGFSGPFVCDEPYWRLVTAMRALNSIRENWCRRRSISEMVDLPVPDTLLLGFAIFSSSSLESSPQAPRDIVRDQRASCPWGLLSGAGKTAEPVQAHRASQGISTSPATGSNVRMQPNLLPVLVLLAAGFGDCQARKARARKVKQRSAPAAAATAARSDGNADASRVKECARPARPHNLRFS